MLFGGLDGPFGMMKSILCLPSWVYISIITLTLFNDLLTWVERKSKAQCSTQVDNVLKSCDMFSSQNFVNVLTVENKNYTS